MHRRARHCRAAVGRVEFYQVISMAWSGCRRQSDSTIAASAITASVSSSPAYFNIGGRIPGIRGPASYRGQLKFLKVFTRRGQRFSSLLVAISTAFGAFPLITLLLLKPGDFLLGADYRNFPLGAAYRLRFCAVRVLLVLLVRFSDHGGQQHGTSIIHLRARWHWGSRREAGESRRERCCWRSPPGE